MRCKISPLVNLYRLVISEIRKFLKILRLPKLEKNADKSVLISKIDKNYGFAIKLRKLNESFLIALEKYQQRHLVVELILSMHIDLLWDFQIFYRKIFLWTPLMTNDIF